MKKIDLIIQILQEELIIRNKSYFSLSQAAKILKEKGILSEFDISNGYLKEKLEKGEIPEAMKTTGKPRLWRIHKDKNYKKSNSTNKYNTTVDKHKQLNLTRQQNIWFFLGTIIFVIILIGLYAGIFYEPGGIHKNAKNPIIKKHEVMLGPEIIYIEIKSALAHESLGTCQTLYTKMQTYYPNSILFDSVKTIYDSAMKIYQFEKEMNIAQFKKEEAQKKGEKYKSKELKRTKSKEITKFLKVDAQSYSDGVLSCNVYLRDRVGNIYYLDAKSLDFRIYDYNGYIMRPTGKIHTSNTETGLYIDIPLGSHVFDARYIRFTITTRKGITYKIRKVPIDY